MTGLQIESINESHKELLNNFRCGEESLDIFLKRWAIYYDNVGEGKTKVLIDKNANKVIGFFTLKCHSFYIHQTEMSEEPRELPAVEISRFAIDKSYQQKGIGKYFLALAIRLINGLKSSAVGIRMITLFSLPSALGFYKKVGFEEQDEDMDIKFSNENQGCIFMYMPL